MNTKKIKIMVAISSDGYWACTGWSTPGDKTPKEKFLREDALNLLDKNPAELCWVEVEIPIPNKVPRVFKGRVTK